MPPLILVAGDETVLVESISLCLERHGYATAAARSGEEAVRLAEEASPDVALMDIQLSGMNGIEILRRTREVSPATEIVMMTAHVSVAPAVEAMKLGAFDYLTKPLDLEELRVVVGKAVTHMRMRRELSYLKARDGAEAGRSGIVGESPLIQGLRKQIERIASLESLGGGGAPTVLILGETGAGKETVARAIHALSSRSAGPFVEINCAAMPASLLKAELFASTNPCLFEAADGGTMFLDGIGRMDPALQVKLVKVIEEKSVRRVGGLRPKTFNARIIAATNRDLETAVAEGSFRADLYSRIKALTIEVPPLRARGSDILLLARYFLDRCTRQYGLPATTLSPEAEALLMGYAWPGNMRELAHVMERAVLLHAVPVVKAEHLGFSDAAAKAAMAVECGRGGVQVDFSSGGIVLDEVERQLIVEALHAAGWKRTRAAQLLGITKETLRYRMEKFQVRPPA